jgi:taurine dioxygenase
MAEWIVQDLSPAIGAVVAGVDLGRDMSDGTVRRLIGLLHDRGVLAIRGQSLLDADYARFGRLWGRPIAFFIAEHRDAAHPEIIRIDNNPATPEPMRDGAVHWHSDSSYEAEPAAVTMLYGKEAPDEGGVTSFASTTAAYEALPQEARRRIDGLVAIHELGQAPWIEGETPPDPNRPKRDMPRQRHPLVMRHPVTGRRAIFTSGTACGIEGWPEAEAIALIRSLREHVAQPQFRTEYKVMPGDIVLWDNFSTVHSASPIDYSDDSGKRRLLYRISTKGVPALCEQGPTHSGVRTG